VTTRRRQQPPSPFQPGTGAAPVGVWLARGDRADASGVVWMKRRMPDGQWPPDINAPRDDSFSWWVRSHCGHPGGAKQWAFYREADADQYEHIFRADPCRYTRCPRRRMIENNRRR